MDFNTIAPGDILVTDFNFGPFPYQHWSLVSDKKCENGFYMLISASERTGTVKEEPVSEVVQGGHTYKATLTSQKPIEVVIATARSQIGLWKYSLLNRNCQHFVNWAAGLGLTSGQLKAGTTIGIIGGVTTALVSEKPTWFKILGVTVACAALGVACSKATPKTANA